MFLLKPEVVVPPAAVPAIVECLPRSSEESVEFFFACMPRKSLTRDFLALTGKIGWSILLFAFLFQVVDVLTNLPPVLFASGKDANSRAFPFL